MHLTCVGYSWNIQGIFLHSIFPEDYLGIFPGISYGTFCEYFGNISCSTNIPRTYIYPVGNIFNKEIKFYFKENVNIAVKVQNKLKTK